MSGVDDVDAQRRNYRRPHNAHNPIPTVQKYREEKQRRADEYGYSEDAGNEPSTRDRLGDAFNVFRHGRDVEKANNGNGPYVATNKNVEQEDELADDHAGKTVSSDKDQGTPQDQDDDQGVEDTTEGYLKSSDPRQARKQMKKFQADGTEREVTDPVTHLPIKIHDYTNQELKSTAKNPPPPGSEPRTMTGTDAINKSDEHLEDEAQESRDAHAGMDVLFPPPSFDRTRGEITTVYLYAVTVGVGAAAVGLMLVNALFWPTRHSTGWMRQLLKLAELGTMAAVSAGVILFIRQWSENKIKNVWDAEVWRAERDQGQKLAKTQTAESTQWLNSLLASVWPLINPDLFTSISDTLEDVMQASLPSMVRMVAVEDLGQGSEALRILGVRWLPTGAAARSVASDGNLKSSGEEKGDRTVQDDGEGQAQHQQDTMEAEDGDFVNVEVAFAYRPSTGKGIKSRAKHAHLLLAFYLPGNVKLPVWVDLAGVVGVMRFRLQLCPDPPFFSVCTMAFMGQPKVTLSCVPLIKKGPNLMDVPLISKFVQSSMDAALAQYVAPKSLTLDLKDMLMGDDFKKDTVTQGVIMVHIKHAFDFKEGDTKIGPFGSGSADPYISVGWAKFGKPVWSTRVLKSNMEPSWDEFCFVCVTFDELNVDEKLRLQLWDSDRVSADDDLGRVELDLKGLMKGDETNGKMQDREDGFRALKAGEGMPGKLSWSVGYFTKTRITDDQLAMQDEDPDVKSIDQLKKKMYAEAENKLREASQDHQDEVEQQKREDFKNRQDQLIIASPPSEDYPSGILSIQIHQITGLELETLNKKQASANAEATDEEEEGEDLPSSYCTIILNHKKVFKTRTKPKNSKPFFNAGCERFIRDVRNTEIHIAVRDARIHEDDALLGIVYLPLEKVFQKRTQINSVFPLAGGIGYGRIRVSMVFRSIQIQLPKNMLGWDYGTVDIKPSVKAIDLPEDLQPLRLKVRTSLDHAKLHSRGRNGKVHSEDGSTVWTSRRNRPIRLPVRARYCAPLVFEFRQDATLKDHTPAFGVFWLKDIPDNEEQTVRVPIWSGDLKRAEENVLDTYGEKVGEIEVTLTMWSGLSGYHEKLAKGDKHLAQVMEVLDTCNDQEWDDWDDSQSSDRPDINSNKETDNDSSSSSSSDSEEDGDSGPSKFLPDFLQKDKKSNSKLSEDGGRGPISQTKEYNASAKQLHRRNRGMMQWKGPRTLAWMKHVGDRGKKKVGHLFNHHERSGDGIETEA
ncbi:Meiotically up-regulated190 protein [Pyrenophora tritici-repentis]|nr:Meiotically up-regulated190 protein [Pyrenophora tritici-repentis]KAI0615437.1 Meiotically up-regulated190 protein [Pyrenophora tritici-repentis]KAI0627494.1 Meiotically up-regulated190 protein [Pyrenophora tritici-repentis]